MYHLVEEAADCLFCLFQHGIQLIPVITYWVFFCRVYHHHLYHFKLLLFMLLLLLVLLCYNNYLFSLTIHFNPSHSSYQFFHLFSKSIIAFINSFLKRKENKEQAKKQQARNKLLTFPPSLNTYYHSDN